MGTPSLKLQSASLVCAALGKPERVESKFLDTAERKAEAPSKLKSWLNVGGAEIEYRANQGRPSPEYDFIVEVSEALIASLAFTSVWKLALDTGGGSSEQPDETHAAICRKG